MVKWGLCILEDRGGRWVREVVNVSRVSDGGCEIGIYGCW